MRIFRFYHTVRYTRPRRRTHIESPDRDAQGVPCQKRGFPKASVASGLRVSGCVVLVLVSAAQRDSEAVTCHAHEYIHAKMTRVWGWG